MPVTEQRQSRQAGRMQSQEASDLRGYFAP